DGHVHGRGHQRRSPGDQRHGHLPGLEHARQPRARTECERPGQLQHHDTERRQPHDHRRLQPHARRRRHHPLRPSAGTTNLIVTALPLSAAPVNFSAIAGAPFTGAVATFTNPDPFGSAGSYTALIMWGDGSTSAGTITGSGTLAVSGPHTYPDPGSYAVSV